MGRIEEDTAAPPPSLVFPGEPRKRGVAVDGPADAAQPPTTPTLTRLEATLHSPYQVINPGIMGGFINPKTSSIPRVWFQLHNQVRGKVRRRLPPVPGAERAPNAHFWACPNSAPRGRAAEARGARRAGAVMRSRLTPSPRLSPRAAQTLNIYTHLLAVLLYGYILASGHAQSRAEQLYCVCTCVGWGLSTLWHATSFISEAFMVRGLALDYVGIVIVGGASNILVAEVEVGGAAPHIAAVGALLFAPYILWFHCTRDIRKAKFGPLNAAHSLGIFVFWFLGQRRWPQLAGILLAYVTYGVSLLIHQSRWPEKWWRSCTFVYSHPIMHVGVALGSLIVYLTYHGGAPTLQ